MAEMEKKTVDAMGDVCPVPLVKAKNAIAEMTNEARKMCTEHNINVGDDLLSVLVDQDADKCRKGI